MRLKLPARIRRESKLPHLFHPRRLPVMVADHVAPCGRPCEKRKDIGISIMQISEHGQHGNLGYLCARARVRTRTRGTKRVETQHTMVTMMRFFQDVKGERGSSLTWSAAWSGTWSDPGRSCAAVPDSLSPKNSVNPPPLPTITITTLIGGGGDK